MATTYTARNRYTNQVQTFEEIAWLSKIQPSGQWILLKKNEVEEEQPVARGFDQQKAAPKVTVKKGCGRCNKRK